MQPDLRHQPHPTGGEFLMEREGRRVAWMTYRRLDHRRILIDHTFVDPALRGQAVARQLLDAAVAWARQTGTGICATCSYVLAQFARDASIRDVFDPAGC